MCPRDGPATGGAGERGGRGAQIEVLQHAAGQSWACCRGRLDSDSFDLFDDGVFSARVQLTKPQPEIFHAAARRFGHAPSDLLFIEYVQPNVDAARALGWQALHDTSAADCEAALPAGTLA